MSTVVLEVRSLTETLEDAARVMTTGRGERDARISFATPELLWKVLTAKRWELLKALCGAGPIAIREAPRAYAARSRNSTFTVSKGNSTPRSSVRLRIPASTNAVTSP